MLAAGVEPIQVGTIVLSLWLGQLLPKFELTFQNDVDAGGWAALSVDRLPPDELQRFQVVGIPLNGLARL